MNESEFERLVDASTAATFRWLEAARAVDVGIWTVEAYLFARVAANEAHAAVIGWEPTP